MRMSRVSLLAGLVTFALTGAGHAACPQGQTICPDGITCTSGTAICTSGTNGSYGATAAGITGNKVGVGYSVDYPTQADADTKALQECQARSNNCTVVGRFWNGGCGYITTAVSDGTCYGYGATPSIALNECQSRGCPCQKPIGGCTKAP